MLKNTECMIKDCLEMDEVIKLLNIKYISYFKDIIVINLFRTHC